MAKPWVVEQIVENAHARTELLWLHAHEKEDAATARELEKIDPALVDRLRAAGVDLSERPGEHPHARSKRFGRLWDECYRRHERDAERSRQHP